MGHSTSKEPLRITLVEDKPTAQSWLNEAEAMDFYQEECREDRLNAIARRRMTYSANSMTTQEAAYYRAILGQARSRLPRRLRMELGEVHVVSLMPTAEGGMPHTRPFSLVCFPHIEQIMSFTTLVHELWHLHQRHHKDTWTAVFAALGWTPWPHALPDAMESHRRYNPDTLDEPLWVYQNTWVPVPVFMDDSYANVTETTLWFYHVHDHYHVKTLPPEFTEQFPEMNPSAYEHPRELTAYLLAEHESFSSSPGLALLLSHLGKNAIEP